MERIRHFLLYLARTYFDDRCLRSASALAYTTLLSLVPLITVVLAIFAVLPIFDNFAEQAKQFIFANFVPTSGDAIRSYFDQFTAVASQLTSISLLFLFISALMLMKTIESTLNDIWHIKTMRHPLARLATYFAMLVIVPLLIGISLTVTSFLSSLPFIGHTAFISSVETNILTLLPFISSFTACTMLYYHVPNTKVPLRHALVGALFAAILFEVAKKGFAFYVTSFPTYQMIYGALSTIPVFLLWIYVSWLVIIFGAAITYCLGNPEPTIVEPAETTESQEPEEVMEPGKASE